MRFYKRLSAAFIPAVALLIIPTSCYAGAGADYLAHMLLPFLLNEVMIAFAGIAAAVVFYYAIRMVIEAHKDESGKDLANSFMYVLTGFAIIAMAGGFANAFGLGTINPMALNVGIISVIDFIISMSVGIFVLIIVLTGLRMIASQGEEGNFDKQRKVLVANCVGVVLMLVAKVIVLALVDVGTPNLIITEMRGMAYYMLTLIGFMSVAALIAAGVLLIVSVDESLKDRAKKIVIGTLVSLLIVVACYSLIVIFIPSN